MGTHYNSDDNSDSDNEGGIITEIGEQSQQHQHEYQAEEQQPQPAKHVIVSSSRKK